MTTIDELTDVAPEMVALLRDTDQAMSNELMQAFADAARARNARTGEIIWALAMLEAAVVANEDFGEPQQRVAHLMRQMVHAALPAAMMKNAQARGQIPS